MRHKIVAAVLVAAGLVGGGLGVVLHTAWPDPFDRAGTSAPGTAPVSRTTSPSPSAGSPSPRRSATPEPSPTSPSPSPSPSPSHGPAFTRLALLGPQNFLERGWGSARQIDEYDRLPPAAITPCTTVRSGQDGLRVGYAATYASERSGAVEIVARFEDEQHATSAYDGMRADVAGCADSSTAADRVRITDSHQPRSAQITEMRWWNTRPLQRGSARGVIGLVRVDDRVALISLRSDVTDPAETTQITSLLTEAGRRLV